MKPAKTDVCVIFALSNGIIPSLHITDVTLVSTNILAHSHTYRMMCELA